MGRKREEGLLVAADYKMKDTSRKYGYLETNY
jgi:hypothetical protein